MGNIYFKDDEVMELKKNPYVKNVSNKAITYSNEFKELFATRVLSGEPSSKVLLDFGINPKILGKRRVDSLSHRVKAFSKRLEGFEDTRKGNSGKKTIKELTTEEEIVKLKHKNLVLEQENQFLKKMIFLAKKVQWEKSLREKNTK